MRTDEINPLLDPEFERASIGDETKVLPTMQNFAFDEYGTRVGALAISVAAEPVTQTSSDPLVRIERTLATALTTLELLQRRIDAIEVSVAEFLRR